MKIRERGLAMKLTRVEQLFDGSRLIFYYTAEGRVDFRELVRDLARSAGLPVAEKRESQDLCFLAGTGRAAFLARHGGISERPGDLVDRTGSVVGRHPGHARPVAGGGHDAGHRHRGDNGHRDHQRQRRWHRGCRRDGRGRVGEYGAAGQGGYS